MVERARCQLVGFLIVVSATTVARNWPRGKRSGAIRGIELNGPPQSCKGHLTGQQGGRRTTLEIGGTALTSSQPSLRKATAALASGPSTVCCDTNDTSRFASDIEMIRKAPILLLSTQAKESAMPTSAILGGIGYSQGDPRVRHITRGLNYVVENFYSAIGFNHACTAGGPYEQSGVFP